MKKKTSGSGKTRSAVALAQMKLGVKQMENGLKTLHGTDNLQATDKQPQGTGVSLHIGVNKLDPKGYPIDRDDPEGSGWDGQLMACERDARDMQKIADSQGYESTILLTRKATAKNVLGEMRKAAKKLASGDSFLLSFSGHGGMVPDISGDEVDGVDETWCMYDRQLIDDELYAAYSEFKAGVQILVLSDSCHSGTVSRSLPRAEPELTAKENHEIYGMEKPVFRLMTRSTSMVVYYAREEFYDEIQNSVKKVQPEDIKASIRLISACQDDEEAADGLKNGKFTGVLKDVWAKGTFDGDTRQFHAAINDHLEAEYARVLKGRRKAEIAELAIQKPNYNAEGVDDEISDKRRPFSI